MATDLHDRAAFQQTEFEKLAGEVRAQLVAARAERDRKHPDPGSVPLADWHTQLGAAEHLRVVRAALATTRSDLVAARTVLAGVTTPAEAGAQGSALAEPLLLEGELEVSERDAIERVAATTALVDDLATLLARAEAMATAATARTTAGGARQEEQDRLRAALTQPPLDTLVTDAGAVLGGALLTDAEERLGTLLPDELRDRAESRVDEALAVLENATTHRAKGEETVADRGVAAGAIAGDVDSASLDLATAEAALDAYVSRGAGRLASATAALVRVAAHPDLTPTQVAAVDPAGRPDGLAAVVAESALADKVAAVAQKQHDLDDAVLTALGTDPDADPSGDAGVQVAQAALEQVRDTDPPTLADARVDYEAARADLEAWEVEVPPSLWDAVIAMVVARRDLQQLANQTARDALDTNLDGATNALGDALDAQDVFWRGDVEVARKLAERVSVETAASVGAASRLRAYARGSGPGGRTPAEL